ncbi:MAG: SusC/RagA family TonB-linked outer membrane protein [Tannerellaceae bacterium]|nr:SusC/RagA family TonB-linked outer membrane protein [Tannerellaceae bacterium]
MKYNFIWLNRIHKIRYGIGICALFIFTSVNAQVTLNEKNQTIRSIIEQIEASGHYQFFYNDELVSLDKKVSVSIKDRPIEYVMDQLLAGTDITYKKEKDNLIVLTLKNIPSAPASTTPEEAQTRMIHGKVVDTTREGIIGANVIEKGNKNGTVTDWNGNFSLSVSENSVLDISYIGYNTTTVPVKGQNTLYIVLSEDTQLIEEVVVTGFGLSQKKATLTGAISTIGAQDIGRSLSATTSGALTGKIAGLNFRQTDSRPGSNTKLQIRNMGDPLYIIDGVAKDVGQFNNIDFNDIESIAILKDASAAIYGVRAANGVIVVTTKKGRKNEKSVVTINSYYGWQSASRLPDPADAVTYVENYIQSETVQKKAGYTYSREDLDKWRQGTEKGYVPFDWKGFIWNTSPQYYLNANISGGSEKINYYISLGHMNQESIIVNYGGMKRYNVQMNIEAQINDRLKIGATMNGRMKTERNPGVPGTDDYNLPMIATYRNKPTIRPYANDNPNYPAMTNDDHSLNFALMNKELSGEMVDTWRMAQLNFNVEYEILDGLKFKALLGYYFANRKHENQEYTYKVYEYDEFEDTYNVVGQRTSAWRERTNAIVEEMTSNLQVAYDKKFQQHTLAAVVGFEASKRDTPSNWLHAIPATNSLHLVYYDMMDKYEDTGNNTEARLGWLWRINYDFANKYLVELSARYDGSWKFPPSHRWGFFPSASLGWRISEETFWKNSKLTNVFDDFKLRGSYGLLGDDNVSGYSAFDYMVGYDYDQGGGVLDGEYITGTLPRNLPVTTLSWIKAKILNVGFDASFLNSRLTGSFDFFRRIRTGLPASRNDVLLPEEIGFSLPFENLNSSVNMGYDFSVRWSDRIQDFTYSIGGNVTYARYYEWEQYKPRFSNAWDEYREPKYHRFGNINWGLVADGQFQSWEEIASWPIDNDRQGNVTLKPGDIKYVDQNGDGVINELDQRPIGYQQDDTPNLNFGINLFFA